MPRKRGDSRLRRWQNSVSSVAALYSSSLASLAPKTHRRPRGHAQLREQLRQQRVVRRVVHDKAAVDAMALAGLLHVVGVGMPAEIAVRLEQGDLVPARQQPRRGQPRDARSDHGDAHRSVPRPGQHPGRYRLQAAHQAQHRHQLEAVPGQVHFPPAEALAMDAGTSLPTCGAPGRNAINRRIRRGSDGRRSRSACP